MVQKRKQTKRSYAALKHGMRGTHGLGAVRSVTSFRQRIDTNGALTVRQRNQLIDQAAVLFGDLYAHLPLKRAMHAIDPLQRLRLLKQQGVGKKSVTEFHAELLSIFKELRDLHTNYSLPQPFGNQIAFLGILVEQYYVGDSPKWMVSKVAEHLVTDPTLVPGVEITHWNGMPMEVAVWRNADKEAGSNQSARLARGLETLTLRSLRSSLPPDEDWVIITYQNNGVKETRLDWRVFDSSVDLLSGATDPAGLIKDLNVPLRYVVGMDERGEQLRQAKKMLFNRAAVKESKRVAKGRGRLPRQTAQMIASGTIATSRPDEISARLINTNHGTFGYLRLWTFHMQDGNIDAFVREVVRLLEDEMPSEGVILDVRGNGGGYIIASEFLLQLLTPSEITPEPAQFIATPGTLDLVKKVPGMNPWRDSLEQSVSTGSLWSSGIPLSPKSLVNSQGQVYFGPVVLITDAYCYSACDMFAAGFQDHEIGPVLGVDEATGAGGANVLTHGHLADDWTGGPLKKLPAGAGMRVSLRRTLRVGKRAGEPVEDLGVVRDLEHSMTRNDLLNGNEDLLNQAGQVLSAGTPRKLVVSWADLGQTRRLHLETLGIQSVDVYVNERPAALSTAVLDGNNHVDIPNPGADAKVRIEGFNSRGELVAARKYPPLV